MAAAPRHIVPRFLRHLLNCMFACCSYVEFKGRTFSSKEEEQEVSKELLNWGTGAEFMCVS
jgi:hypothetical protein